MSTQISKKTFKYRNNLVGTKVTCLCEDMDLWEVIVICARRNKKVKGLLTGKKKNIQKMIKRLIRFQLIA